MPFCMQKSIAWPTACGNGMVLANFLFFICPPFVGEHDSDSPAFYDLGWNKSMDFLNCEIAFRRCFRINREIWLKENMLFLIVAQNRQNGNCL